MKGQAMPNTKTVEVQLSPALSVGRMIAATGQTVQPGETVTVPADLGESLLRQDIWQTPAKPPKPPADPSEVTP